MRKSQCVFVRFGKHFVLPVDIVSVVSFSGAVVF